MRGFGTLATSCFLTLLLGVTLVTAASAADAKPLETVKPVIACGDLTSVDLTEIGGVGSKITAAEEVTANGITTCTVAGTLAPSITFNVLLPTETWQQRYLQVGCGGLCGSITLRPNVVNGCVPYDAGAFVVAATDMGHQGPSPAFGQDPQLRVDFAYRAQHLTAVTAKKLIAAFYGQQQQYAYFDGCSDGGREALMEAQRFPDDFDGIIAGAPAANFQVQNGIYHSWLTRANQDENGKTILLAPRLPILHDAVLGKCDEIDGLKDGIIANPQACSFDPATIQCPADSNDTSKCLTAAEVETVRKIYQGPVDPDTGKKLTVGQPQFGSELAWAGVFVPATEDDPIFSEMITEGALQNVHFPENPPPGFTVKDITFNEAFLDKLRALHPLYDAINPDISAFEKSDGKLMLWHGWSDQHISPINTIAYYQAVEKTMGADNADSFSRLYLFPGVYHCGDGEGPNQADLLTPMMNWVEQGIAPEEIVASLPAPTEKKGFGPRGDQDALPGYPGSGTSDDIIMKRPIYPYPYQAVYDGKGDPAEAASFHKADKPTNYTVPDWAGADLFTPYTPLAK